MTDSLASEGLARFGAAAAGYVASGEVPGLVALVARGAEQHIEVHGSLSVAGPPMREDSLFRIASMTKPVTGAATLALIDEGLLRLDEPVDRLLPELADRRVLRRVDGRLDDTVPAERAITVRDLLTFTFGFGSTTEMLLWPERFPVVAATERALQVAELAQPDPACPLDPDAWLAGLSSLPLIAQPGERWLYNTGAAVLGVLVSRAAGQPLEQVLRTRLFGPLGMRDTGFWTNEPERLAAVYRRSPAGGLASLTERGRDWGTPPAFCDGATGLLTTAGDLLAFSRMLLRGGSPVLSAEAVAEMTRDQLSPEQKARSVGNAAGRRFLDRRSWGFCTFVVTAGPDAGAFAIGGGLGTSWLANPAHDLTVIIMTQRTLDGGWQPRAHRDLLTAARVAAGMPA